MTIGIYKLIFKGTDKVYIGQSINLYNRLSEHITKMKQGLSSKKLLEAYKLYKEPTLEVIELCLLDELDKKEEYYIKQYNSVKIGFNTLNSSRGRSSIFGEGQHNSKYRNTQIIEVFKLLIDTNKTMKEIELETKVGYSTIQSISSGINHKWLKDEFPEDYSKLKELKGKRTSIAGIGKIYPKIISPNGEEYTVTNITQFAKDNRLHSGCLCEVLNNKRKTHLG